METGLGLVEVMLFVWLFGIIGYLACRVAYSQGRKSKWQEMCTEYICIHKSVCIKEIQKPSPMPTQMPKTPENEVKKISENHLTKPIKKSTIKKVVKQSQVKPYKPYKPKNFKKF